MLNPSGSLIFLIVAASSASDAPVGGPDGGAWPFWASVSSPRNQSGGGLVQKSLVPDSYFFRGFCCAEAWLAPATTRIAASARMDRLKADFIASLPMQPGGCACYYFENVRETNLVWRRNRPQNGSTSGTGEKRGAAPHCLFRENCETDCQ